MKRPKSKLLPLRLTEAQWRLAGVALKHWGCILGKEADPKPMSFRRSIDYAKGTKGRKMTLLALRIRKACDKFSIGKD